MAIFCDGCPVIILASGRDSPPWIAYHLAHELGHVFGGHVTADSLPLVDADDLNASDDGAHEIDAEQFACAVLTGDPCPTARAIYGLTAPGLVRLANEGAVTKGIDPGVHALVYGRNAGRMGVAQNALKLMGLDRGARTILSQALRNHLSEDLPESTERFVSLTAA